MAGKLLEDRPVLKKVIEYGLGLLALYLTLKFGIQPKFPEKIEVTVPSSGTVIYEVSIKE